MPKQQEHRRSPKLSSIKIADIIVDPEFIYDPRFQKLLADQAKGKTPSSLTRLPVGAIIGGFNMWADGAVRHVSNLDTRAVRISELRIRQGHRPQLAVYRNPHGSDLDTWVCPDDENPLEAYRNLGVSQVPVEILQPARRPLPNGAVWVTRRADQLKFVASITPKPVESYRSYLGTKQSDHKADLAALKAAIVQTIQAVRAFHIDASEPFHYHHMLVAVLNRHNRAIDTISRLLSLKRSEHAAAIVRLAYEAYLNLHLDWLAPNLFGPRLQRLAELRRIQATPLTAVQRQELKEIEGNFGGLTGLMETVAQKAALSPLGGLHARIYSDLSSVAHQRYGHLEAEANAFDFIAKPEDELTQARWLVASMDFVTAALIHCVEDDIGTAPTVASQ